MPENFLKTSTLPDHGRTGVHQVQYFPMPENFPLPENFISELER